VSPITDDDLDRLADYTAGLLDPAEAAEVDRLIATDDGWARAHDALIAAQPLVDRALARLPEERMPADVAARIEHALGRAAGDARGAGPGQRSTAGDARGAGPGQRPTAIGPGPAAGTGSNVIDLGRARRWRRAALATTAVAAAVAVCAGGLVALNGLRSVTNSATSSAGGAANAPQVTQDTGTVPTILVSGTDYTHVQLATPPAEASRVPDALSGQPGKGAPSGAAAAPGGRSNADAVPPSTAVPAELARLTDPTQLRACLDAIVAVDRGQPTSVDYARYKGQPALIVTLAVGPVTAVAVGPSCGLPGAGPAIIDSAG
jgi:anti-sigma factor RsiW